MSTQTPIAPERVSCTVCMREVPRSEALVAEAEDYVAYFCGLDCCDRWKRQNPDTKIATPDPT